MKAIIFGSGLSGLFAAWACESKGVDYVVYTDRVVKPKVKGFVYLHEKCGLPVSSSKLRQIVQPENVSCDQASDYYSQMVYASPSIPNSMKYVYDNPVVTIWNMSEAVDHIWGVISDRVKLRTMRDLDEVLSVTTKEANVGFSTIPLTDLDKEGIYYSVESYVTVTPDPTASVDFVCYNGGLKDEKAYRWGSINGQAFRESREKPGKSVRKVVFAKYMPRVPDNLHLVGRFGAWDKSQMAHVVYDKVTRVIDEQRIVG